MKRAALYIRVSTQEQAQEGYSIGEQRERLIAYCKAHDWAIADIYVDGGYSGSNLKRPAIQKLMTETAKFDVVLVYKLDRLSRSQRDTLYLIEEIFLPNTVDFVSMQESFDTSSPFGKAMIGLLAVFAQLEREQIKERTQMGRIARAKLGLYHGGGFNPIGYDYRNGKLTINPYEAEQIRKIFKWYLDGMSLIHITELLHKEGYTNRYGSWGSWSSIRNIIVNPIYTGCIQYGGIIVKNAHEAIISDEQFQSAQIMRSQRQEQYGNHGFQSKNLLTGLLICGVCGARYYIKHAGKYSYYYCYSRSRQIPAMVKDPRCKNKIWRAVELESLIGDRIHELLVSPQILKQIAETKRPKAIVINNANANIERRIKDIDKQISKLMELYQLDKIPPELLGENINKLYNEKISLQETLIKVEEPENFSFDFIEALITEAAQVWEFADNIQKRRIIQGLVKRIILTEDEVSIEWNF